MVKNPNFRLLPIWRTLALLALAPAAYASENFLIEPNGALPTSITPGGTATANYNVTNLTSTPRIGYLVSGLPGTVTQVTSAGNCPSPINLNGHESCNLQFTISDAVNSNFALCKGNSCTTASTPLNVSVSANPPPPPPPPTTTFTMIAAGTFNNQSKNLPLLAVVQSTVETETLKQHGKKIKPYVNTVIYPSTILSNFPTNPTFVTPDFHGSSCSGNLCIAGGTDDTSDQFPLVAMSTDAGSTWSYPIDSAETWPSDIFNSQGGFVTASCTTGSFCAIAGQYQDGSNQAAPMLAQFKNGSFTYAITSSNLPHAFQSNGGLEGVSCNGTMCIASGAYNDTFGEQFPLLAQTVDGGTTWTYAIDDTGPLPTAFQANSGGFFTSASCSGLICIAGGTYEDANQAGNMVGDVAQSIDGGTTWTYPIDDGLLPTNFSFGGSINSVSCSNAICLAGGNYTDNGGQSHSMLAQTTNNGSNWIFVIDDTLGPQPTNFVSNGEINSVSCSGNTCVAGGGYNDSIGPHPLLYQTTNAGLSWSTVIDDTIGPQLPDYVSNGFYNSVSCVDNTCIAVGSYDTLSGAIVPIFAESVASGAWTYVIDSTTGLPSDFNNVGSFNTSSGIGNATLAHKMNALKHKLLKPISIGK